MEEEPLTFVPCTRTLFQWVLKNGPHNEFRPWQITNKHCELGKMRLIEDPFLCVAFISDMWEWPKIYAKHHVLWILNYAWAVSEAWKKTKICLMDLRTYLLGDPVVISGSLYLKLNSFFLRTLLYFLSQWLALYPPDHTIQEPKSLIYPHINHQYTSLFPLNIYSIWLSLPWQFLISWWW